MLDIQVQYIPDIFIIKTAGKVFIFKDYISAKHFIDDLYESAGKVNTKRKYNTIPSILKSSSKHSLKASLKTPSKTPLEYT